MFLMHINLIYIKKIKCTDYKHIFSINYLKHIINITVN
jgi:hypothetical protein